VLIDKFFESETRSEVHGPATLGLRLLMANDDQSLVVKLRDYSDIAKLQDGGVLSDFLEQPLTFIAETITGALAIGKTGATVAGGRIVQALLKGMAFKQWNEEFRRLRDTGRIPADFADSKFGFQTWVELMTVIDEETPDADRLEALKAMFYAVNRVNTSDKERILAYQLWQIAKSLKSGELMVLRSIYENINRVRSTNYEEWLAYMTSSSGFELRELFELNERRLVEMLLVSPRSQVGADIQYGYMSGINSENNRLTKLGVKFCRNIETYKVDLGSATES
jgi:hypothetical protein